MVQLIVDGITLPESQLGGYEADEISLSSDVTMITGRLVRELRGKAWRIRYQYGFLDRETKNAIISALNKGRKQPIECGFLTPQSAGTLEYSDFLVTKIDGPSFQWSREGKPLWADFYFEMREVNPHD